jgi:hypothetical protein
MGVSGGEEGARNGMHSQCVEIPRAVFFSTTKSDSFLCEVLGGGETEWCRSVNPFDTCIKGVSKSKTKHGTALQSMMKHLFEQNTRKDRGKEICWSVLLACQDPILQMSEFYE